MPCKSYIGAKLFLKFEILVEISEISKIIENLKRDKEAILLYELSEREPGWWFTARCHTETVAKPGRLGPAQNGEPMRNFVELSMFWCMTLRKVHGKPCRAYHEDQYEWINS